MKRVISYSLWGDKPIYMIGAIENAKDAITMYPDFECWFYIHKPTVPEAVIEELSKFSNVKIILKDGDLSSSRAMTWRFEAIDDPDVEIMMSRDTDSRFLLREKLAVEAWLASGYLFHIMRDHPAHGTLILGGMFGTRKLSAIPSWKILIDTIYQTSQRDYDQTFLAKYIYPHIRNNALIHASFCKYPNEVSIPFPIPYDSDFHFVGEYVNPDKTRNDACTQALRNAVSRS